jgi:hypothetical protein
MKKIALPITLKKFQRDLKKEMLIDRSFGFDWKASFQPATSMFFSRRDTEIISYIEKEVLLESKWWKLYDLMKCRNIIDRKCFGGICHTVKYRFWCIVFAASNIANDYEEWYQMRFWINYESFDSALIVSKHNLAAGTLMEHPKN